MIEIKFRRYLHTFTPDGKGKGVISNDIIIGNNIWDNKSISVNGILSITANLMQYSGHNDVNNKELYDEDIILFLGEIYTIKNMGDAFVIVNADGDECDYLREIETSNCELIGNIYENKELLT